MHRSTHITHAQAANQTFLVSDGQDLSTTELVRGMAKAAVRQFAGGYFQSAGAVGLGTTGVG